MFELLFIVFRHLYTYSAGRDRTENKNSGKLTIVFVLLNCIVKIYSNNNNNNNPNATQSIRGL